MIKIGDQMVACSCANPVCLEKGCQLHTYPPAHSLDIIPQVTSDEVIRLKQEVDNWLAECEFYRPTSRWA